MKRLLIVLALLVLPVLALAENGDRDMLLSQKGALFAIESTFDAQTESKILTLTVEHGEKISTSVVPASLTGGDHTRPALAYDSESDTLFVFWQKRSNAMSSELLVCGYHNATWSEATTIDDAGYRFRYNLGIAVTRKVGSTDNHGNAVSVSGLTVHATWWEESGYGEKARYAMLTIEQGTVTRTDLFDLRQFIRNSSSAFDVAPAGEILRHPVLFESPELETVDIIFGDLGTNRLHRIKLKPVVEGRIRIPIGVKEGSYAAPSFRVETNSRMSGYRGSGERAALFSVSRTHLQYIVLDGENWSEMRSIGLNEKVTPEAAMEVVRRMINAE